MNIHTIILTAGKGTRMKTEKPKVLHKIKRVVLIDRVLNSLSDVSPHPTIIIGYKGEEVINHTKNKYHYIWQKEQLGTGHAVLCAKDELQNKTIDSILVIYGDHPFISKKTIEKLTNSHTQKKAKLTMTTVSVPNFENKYNVFYDYGRIIRDKNKNIKSIVEIKDANDEQKKIKELNVGYYCFDAKWLWNNIEKIKNDNNLKEYCLTDIIKIALEQGVSINSIEIENPIEAIGVNSIEQLKTAEKSYQ